MTPYFDSEIKPTDQLMKLKLHEGVYSLLNIDKRFYPCLFDFTEPWKLDILDFMDKNYMYDLSVEDIANYTGRSLASFKRDFKKISPLPPQKWLIEKRLRVAHDKIRTDNVRVSDVYLEVGFKNLSHFSTAYKKQYGYSPTK
jgi:AraC-like DNA-binding protein